ncbi:MAG TPA: hypothetical protein VK822_21365 [Acetobacteraceae bacterium]|jgi:hypothetical protein|nr:hypothetical protein [Acetobacteraceae bacterium]
MGQHANKGDILLQLYAAEVTLSGYLDHFGFAFSPVLLSGDVADPGFYNLPTLAPVTTQTATYTAAGTPVTDTYTGVKLWDLLSDAGGATVTSAKNDILSKYVVATGSDGYKAVFSLGEIDPSFGAQPVMVAYADTGGQLGPQGSDGLARMVVPGDQAGGRYVSDLVNLDVRSLPEPGPSGPGGISDQLAFSGEIADPSIVTPASLTALNQSTTETATYTSGSGQVTDTYTGVSLWTLIQDAGLLTDPSIKNDLLRFGVVATGSDGYRAFISLGEIDPAFGNQPDLVAYADTGGQLGPGGQDGALRLIVPGDVAGGRYVSNLTSLQVIDAVGGQLT